jgi:hypothetical protein
MVAGLSFVLVFGIVPAMAAGNALGTQLLVHFSLDQDGGLSKRQLSQAVDEARNIWRSAGVAVTSGRYGEPAPSGSSVVSLRLLGGVHKRSDGGLVLGWVMPAPNGGTVPTVFISLGSLNEFLSDGGLRPSPFAQRPLALRQRLTGRAVGRIMAHELGHYLLNGGEHAKRGLLRPHYSPEDLTVPWLAGFQIPSPDRLAIQREVARLAELQRGGGVVSRGSR